MCATRHPSAIVALIDALIANAEMHGWLFHGNFKGRRSSTLSTRFTGLERELGFTDPCLLFHSIRHTVLHLLDSRSVRLALRRTSWGMKKKGCPTASIPVTHPSRFKRNGWRRPSTIPPQADRPAARRMGW